MQHRETKELLVTEIKTSTYPGDIADWKNSEQTLGYYTFLKYLADKYGYPIAPKILYIVSQAGKYLDYEDDFGFNLFWIPQSEETILEFNANLIVDILTIELYIDHGHFPKRGSSCKTFGRVCEFFDLCDLEKFTHTEAPLESGGYKSLTLDDADFQIDLSKLIARSSDS